MPPEPDSVLDTRAPHFGEGELERILAAYWDIEAASLHPLPSERDLNVLVDDRFVLKVSNPAERADLGDMEDVALAHVRRVAPDLPVPRLEAGSGIDLIRPDGRADREFALSVCDGLVARGVLAGLTGPTGTVLKVRPPLIWREDHADRFVDALAATLTGR